MSVSKHHKTSDSKCLYRCLERSTVSTSAFNDNAVANHKILGSARQGQRRGQTEQAIWQQILIWPTGDAAIAERSARRSVSVEMLYE